MQKLNKEVEDLQKEIAKNVSYLNCKEYKLNVLLFERPS